MNQQRLSEMVVGIVYIIGNKMREVYDVIDIIIYCFLAIISYIITYNLICD